MLFQVLDNKQECYKIYCDNQLVEDYQARALTHTWAPSSHFLEEDIEYAQIWSHGKNLNEVCPPELKQKWDFLNEKAKVFIRSFYNAKVNLDDVCFYDMVPKKFLLDFYEVKNKISRHVFESFNKPKNYFFLRDLVLFLKKLESRELNLDFTNINCYEEKTRNSISKIKNNNSKIVYNPWRTVTGRLTTESTSFPILTLKKELRSVLKPQNDVFVEFDFNAAELRVLLGLLGQTQPQEDIHAWINENVFANKLTREATKKKTFSWLYNPKAKNKKLNGCFDREKLHKEYYTNGSVRTPFNREIPVEAEKAVSYLVQSTTSDMLLTSAMAVEKELKHKKSFVCFCIHDSIVVDLSYDDKDLIESLGEVFAKTKFGKLKTNLSIGKDFGNMKRPL